MKGNSESESALNRAGGGGTVVALGGTVAFGRSTGATRGAGAGADSSRGGTLRCFARRLFFRFGSAEATEC